MTDGIQRGPAGGKPSVALIAVVSDEAAYVAEFVFHHLHFGFAPIFLYVNNSADQTAAILRRIAAVHPQVVPILDDGMRASVSPETFQTRAYERIVREHCLPRPGLDYVAILDVDEFWTPVDLSTSVHTWLTAIGRPDIAQVNWFIPDNDDALFHLALTDDVAGHHHILVKSLWRVRQPFTRITPHGLHGLAPDCRTFSEAPMVAGTARTDELPPAMGGATIVHRMYRSPAEYVSLLGRGNPDDAAPFKRNRQGYRFYRTWQTNPRRHVLAVPPEFRRMWRTSYDAFVASKYKVLPKASQRTRRRRGR